MNNSEFRQIQILSYTSHLQWETTASLEGDAGSPVGDLLASPNFGICEIIPLITISLTYLLTTDALFFFRFFAIEVINADFILLVSKDVLL